jgi:8-oxo-dGTP diphosphatase
MAHIHDKIDFTVVAVIVHKRKLLMIEHLKLKKWLFIGGHIELDEDPETALYREIFEEGGLTSDQLTVYGSKPTYRIDEPRRRFLCAPTYLDIHPINETHSHIGMVYFVESKTDQVVLEATAHNAIRWFEEGELDLPLYNIPDDIKFYGREGLRMFK